MTAATAVLAVLLLAVGCVAPTEAGACKTGCPASHTANAAARLRFQPGQLYTYDLHSTVAVQLSGADAADTKLTVTGRAELAADADGCSHSLRLDGVIIAGPDGKRNTQLGELHLDRPVRFTLANDRLLPEICTDAKETVFGLNVKRAIISLLQSTANADETDVFGTCPQTVTATPPTADGAILVSKKRTLNACASRESVHSALLDSVRTADAVHNRGLSANSPLLNGDYALEQNIKAGVLEKAQLTEEYAYLPHSVGAAGLRARVTTKLQLKKTAAGKLDGATAANVPATILFESPAERAMKKLPEGALKGALVEAVEAIVGDGKTTGETGGVRPQAAAKFSELVHLLRVVSKEELLVFNKQIGSGTVHGNKETARAVFLDALFRAATSESVEAVAQLLGTKNALDRREKRMAVLGLHLVQSVERDALQAIGKLLDANAPTETYLAVGHLLHRYCHTHPADCGADHVRDIQAKFTAKLGAACKPVAAANRHAENSAVAALKGLRNTQHLIAPEPVIACTGDQQSTRVRVAALQTLQTAAACHRKTATAVLAILENRDLDAELRIEAYLTLVACPSAGAANALKSLLDTETSQQVGAFITSHLAAVRSSVDPHRAAARGHFANVRTARKFPADIRQYSFAHETSYAAPALGAGAAADTRVIYSARSFVPRSVHLNVTGQLFGESYAVLELEARQENLDRVLERNFGPKGIFNRYSAQEIYDYLAKVEAKPEAADRKTGPKHRGRRSVRDELAALLGKTPADAEAGIGDTELDLSVRLFGTELFFLSLNEQVPLDPKEVLQKLYAQVRSLVRSAKGFNEVWEVRTLFLDAELVYPTGVGFPLRLIAHGSGAAKLQVSGAVDVEAIAAAPRQTKFTVKAVPSYSAAISGLLTVDGFAVSTGLQLEAQIHSSTGAEVDFKLVDGGFETAVRLPFKKQEIFSFEHNVVTSTQERGQPSFTTPVKFSSKPTDYNGCFDQLHRFVGVTVCAHISGVAPGAQAPNTAAHPLNGPLRVGLSLEVEREYTLKALLGKDPAIAGRHHQLTLHFDTPGSADVRRTQLQLTAVTDWPKRHLAARLEAPNFKAAAEAGLHNDATATYAFASYTGQETQKYLVKLGVEKSRAGKVTTFKPIAHVEAPGKDAQNKINGWHVTGTVTATELPDDGVRLDFNQLQVHSPAASDKPFTLNGQLAHTGAEFSSDLRATQAGHEASLKGELRAKAKDFRLDVTVLNNVAEYANGRLAVEAVSADGELRYDLIIVSGRDVANQNRRLEVHVQSTHSKLEAAAAERFLKSEARLVAPFLPAEAKLSIEANRKLVAYDASGKVGKHQVASKLQAKLNEKVDGDYDVEASAAWNKYAVKVEASREIKDGRSKLENSVELEGQGAKMELDVEFDHGVSAQRADVKVEGSLRLAKADEPHKVQFQLKATAAKLASEACLTAPKHGELVKYELSMERDGASRSGKWSASVKDLLVAEGAFQSVQRKGDGHAQVQLPALSGRKLRLDTVFNVAAPVYDVRTELLYDADKDAGKKLTVDTKNKYSEQAITSATEVVLGADTWKVAVQAGRTGQLPYGTQNANVQVTLPSQRELGVAVKRELNADGKGVVAGTYNLKLTDTLANKKQRSLQHSGKLSDAQPKLRLFSSVQQLEYSGWEGETAAVQLELRHQPAGEHFRGAAIKLSGAGTLLPAVPRLEIIVDEYCAQHAVFHAEAAYGTKATGAVKGNYRVGSNGGKEAAKPWTYDVDASAALPELSSPQKVHLRASGSVQLPPLGAEAAADGAAAAAAAATLDVEHKLAVELNDKRWSLDTHAKGTASRGSANVKLTVPQQPAPIELRTAYGVQRTEAPATGGGAVQYAADGTVELAYAGDKHVKLAADYKGAIGRHGTAHLRLETPFAEARIVELSSKGSRSDDGTTVDGVTTLKVNDAQYSHSVHLQHTDDKQSVELKYTGPQNPADTAPARVAATVQRLADSRYSAELVVENVRTFGLQANGEVGASGTGWDAVYAKGDIHAPALRLNHVHAELATKAAPGGGAGQRALSVTVTADGKNVVSGSADYTVAQNAAGVTVATGSGTLKIYEQQKQATFELRRGAEGAASLVFNANVGGVERVTANVVLRAQNFQVEVAICEDNNRCYTVALKSRLTVPPTAEAPTTYAHTLLVHVDLLELGWDKEFILNAETSRRPAEGFRHQLEMSLKPRDKKIYVYRVQIGGGKALVELQLPKRTMAVQVDYQVPKQLPFGRYEVGVASYPDRKNKPETKAALQFAADIARPDLQGEKSLKASAQLQFAHPLVRTLTIRASSHALAKRNAGAKLELDVFRTEEQALLLEANFAHEGFAERAYNASYSATVRSKGLGIDVGAEGHSAAALDRRQVTGAFAVNAGGGCRTSAFWAASENSVELVAQATDVELLRVEGKLAADAAHLEAVLQGPAGIGRPVKAALRTKGWRSIVAEVGRPDVFGALAELTWAKVAKVQLSDAAGKDVFRAQIALDLAHLLATEIRPADREQLKRFAEEVRDKWQVDATAWKAEAEKRWRERKVLVEQQLEQLRSAVPDVGKALEAYKEGAQKLRDELLADKTVKELFERYERIAAPIRKSVSEIAEVLLKYAQSTYAALYQFYADLARTVQEKVWPAVQASLRKLGEQAQLIAADTQHLVLQLVERVFKALREFEPELQLFGQKVAEYARRLAEFSDRHVQSVRKELADVAQLVRDGLHELPGWEWLKEKLAELGGHFSLPVQWEQAVREALASLRDLVPGKEAKKFVEVLAEYIDKKLTNTKTDDLAELQKLYAHLITAVRALYAQLANEYGLSNYTNQLSADSLLAAYGTNSADGGRIAPLSSALYHFLKAAVQRLILVHYSGLNYIRHEQLPLLSDTLYAYRPYAFEPHHWLPPFEKHAQLVDGRHAFTFAGAQISFDAAQPCSYVLANDAVNGNFTIVARVAAGGHLESIALLDRSCAADAGGVELLADGVAKLNGAAVELPAIAGDLKAWRRYHTINAYSAYGARLECSLDLRVCSVTVNGFYHGQLRGVLGAASTEPQLDGRLPGGKAATKAEDLVQAYALGSGCSVQAHSHDADDAHTAAAAAAPSPLCSEYFKGATTPLSLCFPFLHVRPYRAACEHAAHSAATGDQKEAACAVASAYAAACRAQHIPVDVPAACLQCPTPDQQVGGRFAAISPAKQADVVVVVDTATAPQRVAELVQPVLQELRKELRARDVADVQVAVLGYQADRKWVKVFATAQGKLNWPEKVKVPVHGEDLAGEKLAGPLVTGNERVDGGLKAVWRAANKLKSDYHQSADGLAFREALAYPFRAGASKAIVAIRADQLQHSANPAKLLAAKLINMYAAHRGIQLHLLTPLAAPLKSPADFKLGAAIGYGRDSLLGLDSAKPKKPLQLGTAAQRTAAIAGDGAADLGADLVEQNSGYVFDLGAFAGCKTPAEQRKYVAVVAAALADKLARTEQRLECRCAVVDGVRAAEECAVKETKWKEPIKRVGNARG